MSLRSKPKYRLNIVPNDEGVFVIVFANQVDNKIDNNDRIKIAQIRIVRLDLASITKSFVSFDIAIVSKETGY